mgnify:CR=1 FL=1
MAKNNWKGFERLVAAINAKNIKNGTVTWNDTIDGRQFDATIRFKAGDYDFLTVIECKDYKSRVPIEKVEAFVTKSRGAKANKAVLFSRNGFQSGCKLVAEQYGIELFELSEDHQVPESLLNAATSPAINIYEVSLSFPNRPKYEFEDGPQLYYALLNTYLKRVNEDAVVLETFLSQWADSIFGDLTRNSSHFRIPIPTNTELKLVDEDKWMPISSICLKVKIIDALVSDMPVVDHYVSEKMSKKIVLTNTLSKTITEIPFSDIDHGFDTILKAKTFYHALNLGFDYYCEKIVGDIAHFILLGSYQHGRKIDAKFTAKVQNSRGYTEITDKLKLEKLRKYLKKFQYKNRR